MVATQPYTTTDTVGTRPALPNNTRLVDKDLGKGKFQRPLGMEVPDFVALMDCVRLSVREIGNSVQNYSALALAAETYKDRHWRALRAGIKKETIATKCQKTYTKTISTTLDAIADAMRDNDGDDLQTAIASYEKAWEIATQAGISQGLIRQSCHHAYYGCLIAALQALTRATITGDHERRGETLADWYEDCRYRMTQAGFQAESIDTRMQKLMKDKLK